MLSVNAMHIDFPLSHGDNVLYDRSRYYTGS